MTNSIFFPAFGAASLRVLDDFCDERKVEQRLAALKLDLDA